MTDDVEVQYKCTGIYNGAAEAAIRWDDPDIGITWPVKDARLSDKDRNAQTLKNWLASPDSDNFSYEPQVALSR
jgi:dTDP-4-dehydrorhamnose 3,5-epimerase